MTSHFDNGPLVSVVVPVYNVIDYLEDCLKSVISQTYRSIEIVIVDDGSTDGSGEMCDALAELLPDAVVIHKENGGLSDARNVGLEHSRGELVSFIDSDDLISPFFVEFLVRALEVSGCDIAAVPRGTVFADGAEVVFSEQEEMDAADVEVLNGEEYIRRLLYQNVETGVPWRLYRRELLGEAPFPVGIYYEDLASVYRIVRNARKIALIPNEGLYAYRMRKGSILHNENYKKKVESASTVVSQLYADIAEWYPRLSAAASSRCFSVCRNVFAQTPWSAREERDRIWGYLVRHGKVVVSDSSARPRERFAAALSRFGQPIFYSFCMACRKTGLMI